MPFILLDIDAWGAFWLLLYAETASLKARTHDLWFWVIAVFIAYLGFEYARAHFRQRGRASDRD
ncbi:hypothetical protein ABIB68_007933 [Bradyrhizobium sp. F1.2.2]